MTTVELIYDSDCPNVPKARENLLRALGKGGITLQWREWERADASAPAYVQAYGSPTILVNGRDVAGVSGADAACCRIYTNEHGAKQGVPPVSLIVSALGRHPGTSLGMGKNAMSLLPAVGTALMPKLVCPICWPAYTAILSAMGIGFINYTPVLMPLTAAFLLVVLVMLAWRAKARRGYAPLILGVLATAMLLIGKFQFDSDAAAYSGIALLVGTSLWNAWPRRISSVPCPACVTDGEPGAVESLKGGTS
jgi:mercuric ion transport protein